MKRKIKLTYLLVVLLCSAVQVLAQRSSADSNSFYTRNQLHLETPAVFLNAARIKANAGDTAMSVHYIIKAATLGLTDTLLITNDSEVQFVAQRKEWPRIRNVIIENASRHSAPVMPATAFFQQAAVAIIHRRNDEI
ncbi:MAG: hypothetical protein JNM19_16060 [Chitinophagaceae bacterium]|nr:hypothetical protein [Chitinophagaceae bacterium]